ncbi:unnamed protein product [Ectocarpus sp. 4 AP-2014]
MAAATSLNAVLLLSCCCSAAQGLCLGANPAGWQRKQQHSWPNQQGVRQHQQQQQLQHHPLHARNHRRAALPLAAASDGSSRRNSDSSRPETTAGFGSRASRRSKKGRINKNTDSKGGLATAAPAVVLLKRSSRWACVKNCGACCYLAPDERPDLAEYLPDPEEFDLYMSMTGGDGWCKHFDKESRACTVYSDRPRFCRVETETFGSMYGVEPEDMDDFCSSCCNEQISDVYGAESKELRVFNEALAALERGERPKPDLSAFGGDLRGQGEGQIRDWGLEEER